MMRPIPIPQFVVENEDEQAEYDTALAIREHMLQSKNKS
jgi:hypothetical protein